MMRLHPLVLSFFCAAVIIAPLAAQARALRAASSSSAQLDLSVVTWGQYRGKSIYAAGKWSVEQTDDTLAFTKGGQTIRAITIPKDSCAYTAIRIRAQKAWNTQALEQSQSQIRTLVLGRSDYKGYMWYEPPQGALKNRHWCLSQDAKNAMELIVTSSDANTLQFADQNLIRQLAVRRAAR